MNSTTLPKELIIMGKQKLDKEKFKEIRNKNFIKPEGGLWASPYIPNNKYVSAWHEWCEDYMDNWVRKDCIILTLKKDTRWYCINNQNDLEYFIRTVGEQESITSLFKCIDFENAKKHFDVIYLTENGLIETHMPLQRQELNLYGWDCESCLILNYDCIDKWEYKNLDKIRKEN